MGITTWVGDEGGARIGEKVAEGSGGRRKRSRAGERGHKPICWPARLASAQDSDITTGRGGGA